MQSIKMSYTRLFYHIVFRTKYRIPCIDEMHEEELYRYIWGIINNKDGVLYRIGGMPDHVHLFVSLPPTLSIASFVQRVKTDSSKWLKANPNFPYFQGWAREYAGISKSSNEKDTVVSYIMRQKEHHKRVTFAEEYRAFLEENGITIDERYFLRDD